MTRTESHPKMLERDKEGADPQPQRSGALLTPPFQTSGLWNGERIQFCVRSPPVCGDFVTVALGDQPLSQQTLV